MKQTLKQQLFYQGKLFMHNNYIILLFVNIVSCNSGEKNSFWVLKISCFSGYLCFPSLPSNSEKKNASL